MNVRRRIARLKHKQTQNKGDRVMNGSGKRPRETTALRTQSTSFASRPLECRSTHRVPVSGPVSCAPPKINFYAHSSLAEDKRNGPTKTVPFFGAVGREIVTTNGRTAENKNCNPTICQLAEEFPSVFSPSRLFATKQFVNSTDVRIRVTTNFGHLLISVESICLSVFILDAHVFSAPRRVWSKIARFNDTCHG